MSHTVQEAIDDPNTPITKRKDIDDILIGNVKNKGCVLAANELEGRSQDLWFPTKAKRKSHLK